MPLAKRDRSPTADPVTFVDADANEFALGGSDLVVVVADQGQRNAPRVQPSEVGDEGRG